MKKTSKVSIFTKIPSGVICLVLITALFCYMGSKMGAANMLNTIMKTAHDLLLNTCFYLMAICVITGAIGKLFVEFGVVDMFENSCVHSCVRYSTCLAWPLWERS